MILPPLLLPLGYLTMCGLIFVFHSWEGAVGTSLKCQKYLMEKPALVGPFWGWGLSILSLFLCLSISSNGSQLCAILDC